jgi:hypothetical protein
MRIKQFELNWVGRRGITTALHQTWIVLNHDLASFAKNGGFGREERAQNPHFFVVNVRSLPSRVKSLIHKKKTLYQ